MVEYERELAKETVMVTDRYALIGLYDTMEDPHCTVHEAAPEPEPEDPENPENPDVDDPDENFDIFDDFFSD